MRKVYLMCFAFVLCFKTYKTQETAAGVIKEIPSPEVSDMEKFTEFNISPNKGIPDITVPLFTITSGDLTYPVNLNYFAGGVKVYDTASDIGLGWQLSAEKMITREQRGQADEYFFFGKTTTLDYKNTLSYQMAKGVLTNENDLEADLFSFSTPFATGKFYYDQTRQDFITDQPELYKIRYDDSTKIWEITDARGIVYQYKDYTGTSSIFIQDNNKTQIPINTVLSAPDRWKLFKIISPDKKEIDFVYTLGGMLQYKNPATESYTVYTDSQPPLCDMDRKHVIVQTTMENIASLTDIVFAEGRIHFTYNSQERKDQRGGRKIDFVELIQGGNTVKKYSFIQSFVPSNDNTESISPINQQYYYRMFLDEIQVVNSDNSFYSYRKFNYIKPGDLPNRLSRSIDFWGGYNAKQNSELIPKTTVPYNFSKRIKLGSADRKVNRETVANGTMQSMTLSTMGRVNYTYESNEVAAENYPMESMAFFNEPEINQLFFEKNDRYKSTIIIDAYQYSFTIPPNIIEINYTNQTSGCASGKATSFCDYSFEIYEDNLTPFSLPIAILNSGSGTLSLQPGNYIFLVKDNGFALIDGGLNRTFQSNLIIEYEKPLGENERHLTVGGLRIHSIKADSGSGTLTRKYNYNSLESNQSSGRVYSMPTFYRETDFYCDEVPFHNITMKSNPFMPQYDDSGQGVFYTNVTETQTDDSGQIKGIIKYSFDYQPDGPQDVPMSLIILPSFSMDSQRGNLRRKQQVGSDGYKIIQSTANEYDDLKASTFIDNYYVYTHALSPSAPSTLGGMVFTGYYQDRVAYARPKTTVDSLFFDGNKIITTSESFEYNLDTRNLLNHKTIFKDGSETIQTYQYAHEKNNPYLIAKNMIGIPLQTVVTKNGKTISSTETKYPVSQSEANSKTSGLPTPYAELSYDLQSGVATNAVTYDRYDPANGNLLQYSDKGLVPTAIIWGYHNTQPIAKVEGATYAIAASAAAAIIAASNADADAAPGNDESALLAVLSAFRNNSSLAGYQVTTYSYDPLIGVRSITPPSGITEFYEYDPAGRLKSVKDVNGNILKDYQYHYKP